MEVRSDVLIAQSSSPTIGYDRISLTDWMIPADLDLGQQRRSNVSELAMDSLLNLIRRRVLKPGDRLPHNELWLHGCESVKRPFGKRLGAFQASGSSMSNPGGAPLCGVSVRKPWSGPNRCFSSCSGKACCKPLK